MAKDIRKIATGIEGIRKILADNLNGWHVWIDGVQVDYFDMTLDDIRTMFSYATLIHVTGNGLSFAHMKTVEEMRAL